MTVLDAAVIVVVVADAELSEVELIVDEDLVVDGGDTDMPVPPLIEAATTVRGVAVTVRMPDGPVLRLMGYAMTYMVPALAIVEVIVVGRVKDDTVEVAANEDPMLLAFSMTAGAMGTPYDLQISETGPTNDVVLRLLSQLPRIHVMTLVRKLPFERRQRHGISMPLHVKSPLCARQSW